MSFIQCSLLHVRHFAPIVGIKFARIKRKCQKILHDNETRTSNNNNNNNNNNSNNTQITQPTYTQRKNDKRQMPATRSRQSLELALGEKWEERWIQLGCWMGAGGYFFLYASSSSFCVFSLSSADCDKFVHSNVWRAPAQWVNSIHRENEERAGPNSQFEMV